jgi:hypothetical protein
MTARSKLLQIRLTEDELDQLHDRAKSRGMSVSDMVRKHLELRPVVMGVATMSAEPDMAEPEPVAEAQPEPVADLDERRERRARELAVKMPLRNARMLAAREIAE